MALVIEEAEKQKLFRQVRHRLGAPLRKVELSDEQMCTLLEIAVEDHSSYINEWLIEAQWSSLDGINLDTTDLIPLKQELYTLFKKYTIVLIDCPPAINSFSRLGVLLGQYIMCPLIATENCYRASALAMKSITNIIQYNKDFIDYNFFLSSNSKKAKNIKAYIINKYKDDLKDKLLKEPIPDFVGVEERESMKKNIFIRYKDNHDSIVRIKKFMKQIENLIYIKR